MGFFDFLKKKELARIAELEQENEALSRYRPLLDIDRELDKLKEELAAQMNLRDEIAKEVEDAKITLDILKHDAAAYEEVLEYASYGVYSPHFRFDTSDEFKAEITAVRDRQKELLKSNRATKGGEGVSWNGSLAQGEAMMNRQKKLMMRAFNGEADSFIKSVDWNNALRMEERLRKSYDAINATAKTQNLSITKTYYDLKLRELRLTFEYKVKKNQEKEEQRRIREQIKEEERAIREMEQARLRAEKEEKTYLAALEKARKELGTAAKEKQDELLQKIAELEAGLTNAEAMKQKAISMAQQTKMGYVYVISNIGSFGEDVYKIGMTRRLDPMDRVRELGDASVPFLFDVHAMIFSENAPELEAALHKEFDRYRVNMVNPRREFFRINLNDIQRVAKKHGAKVEFTMIAEAQEYRETQRIIKSKGL